MSQQELQEIRPWVIITVFKENTNPNDLQRILPDSKFSSRVANSSKDDLVWAFNNDATSMTIFEGTEQEANEFHNKYDRICSGILQYSRYQGDAMPILSVLSK